jgi:signal transduction histidine kinase
VHRAEKPEGRAEHAQLLQSGQRSPHDAHPSTREPASGREENQRRIDLILATLDELPTLSAVATRVLAWGAAGEVDIDEGSLLIESDPALAARILALCARADKGLATKVSSVKHAVVLLGVETVRSAALSVAVVDLLRQAQQRGSQQADAGLSLGFDREDYWRFCVGVGAACEALARAQASALREGKRATKPLGTGQAFLAGLLSGLGRIALAWALPSAYDRVVRLARMRACATSTVEHELLGIDHFAAARRLAERWGLPPILVACMWMHDAPASGEHADAIALVTAGRAIARSLALGDACDAHEHMTSAQACASAGLTTLSATQIESVCETTRELAAHRARVLGLGERAPEQTVQQQLAKNLARATQRVTEAASTQTRALSAAQHEAQASSHAMHVVSALARAAEHDWTTLRAGSALLEVLGKESDVRAVLIATKQNPQGTQAVPTAHSKQLWRAWQLGVPAAQRDDEQGKVLELPGSGATALEGLFVPGAQQGNLGQFPWLAPLLPFACQATDQLALHVHALASDDALGLRVLLLRASDALLLDDNATRVVRALLLQAAKHDEARALQDTLLHMQRELAASQAKATHAESMVRLGQTTAGAAHEMNTPLAVIVGRAQLLLTRLRDERDKAAVQAIAGSARQISDLISSLHVLSTPPTPALAPTALRDVIDQAIVAAQGRLCSDVAVQVDTGKDDALFGMTDGALLARVLTELLTNALEACPKGPVSVRVRWGEALGSERFDAIFEVRDEGRGPSDAALSHAFDPFFSERPSGRGKGLGLSRARAIVQALGGSVRLVAGHAIGQARGAAALVRVPMQRLDKPGLLVSRVR